MGKRHKPEEIIGKLREAEIVLAQGGTTADACRRIAVTEQTYYRWRKEYGGLKTDQCLRPGEAALVFEPLRRRHELISKWDRQGLVLHAKRLERGQFTWPATADGVAVLTPAQLSMLLEGVDWRHPIRSSQPTLAW